MKYIGTLVMVIVVYFIIGNVVATNNLIPEDAIRIRVIANSDSEYDQQIKYKVKDSIQVKIFNLLKNVKGSENARKVIKHNLENIKMDVSNTLLSENYNLDFEVNYGKNYFPEKKYKGITYKEGYYESLVITLGEGKGENWWCVLFPPLCLVEAESSNETEYTTFVKELIDKYL